MINPNDSIRYTNVVSKKYRFHYKNIDAIIKEFLAEVVQKNINIKGPLFYSINNVPMDEMVNAEFFMPIVQDHIIQNNDLYLHSYYAVEEMISICIYNQIEKTTEIAYHMLLDYMNQHQLNQVTPFYHVISGDETLQYVFIKVGVSKIE
ncbi:DUF5085 family protein [Cytobacillus purgationiresistens]|uniref:Effector-binding domain-containing protein n=1 Tax=Cytobacillus purgationiresistens TaxID=863449 RepID=A0ABU0AQP7_9BACI|nr:DUF5085 family protein [Cytobacillus purgationiresistens]MDQ0272733.1 effector-binding domain-containing protein [Cytobacillus purgationiresistens]